MLDPRVGGGVTLLLLDDNDDDDDDDDVVGYIHLLTPRHAKHKSWEIGRIITTPRHIQRA